MSKITSVEPQKKTLRLRPSILKSSGLKGSGRSPHRFNIFLDGEFGFGADEDLIVEYRLVVGKMIDQSLLEKLLFDAEVGKLMERMYRLWNIRPRSEKEVRNYLKDLSFKRRINGQEEISLKAQELLINKLKQKRLVSDEDFAKQWTEARRKSRQKGIRAIEAELYQKGINKEIVEKVIKEQTINFSEEQLAEQVLGKKWKIWQRLPLLEKKKKAYQLLIRRGFEYEVVRDVIEKISTIG